MVNVGDSIFNISSGVTDKNGLPLCVGDKVHYVAYASQEYEGVIRFGEYEQDGSGGEYVPHKCVGFYIERTAWIQMSWQDPDDEEWSMPEYQKTISLYDSEWIEIISRKDDVN